jgi:CMP-N-acetylneuraminic acid synthetase
MEMMKKNIVAIICARGGSKGLFKKNIQLLLGKPLIAYTIMAAKNSKFINRIIVSTDDGEIAKISKQYGADVPFMRPPELSQDSSPAEPALKYTLEWLEKNENYKVDIVVYLQVTDVFRQKHFIDDVIKSLIEDDTLDTAFIGHPTHKKYWKFRNNKYKRLTNVEYNTRQTEDDSLIREDTGLACATRAGIIKQGLRIGNNIKILLNDDGSSSLDIHTKEDLENAEIILKKHKRLRTNKYYY